MPKQSREIQINFNSQINLPKFINFKILSKFYWIASTTAWSRNDTDYSVCYFWLVDCHGDCVASQ
ncbi:hypothetical protein OFO01_04045 [Campylobacter sp. JMF_01 NE2]|uniref:hypothetical protein n=1 Tax=unclassified Campylobacter TaxID=2593542 RepID=UPI0022E9A526|nr:MULTISPECIES: hypothetical protein [unclassified Campylobacter]MDA3052619.1 hypothetical protein [Campylobacter sp. JMF_03 NE3]MDA3066950.1 hypothetical protein [Campylobacter sp. JMF_01 NE2]